MSARGVLRVGEGGYTLFWCPGCKEAHAVRIREDGQNVGGAWGFNGDYDRPTFSPSVRVGGHKLIHDETGKWTGEWERDAAGNPVPSVCHSFVRDGQIQFLGDCTHALAGRTVPLKPFDEA